MLQTSTVSPQVSSFILNTRIPDSDIPLAFFGLRTVQEIHCQPDECHLNKLSPELLEFIARKLSFSDFVNFSATHTRNLSCLRSDFLINKIFDSDESVQELLLLKDLLKIQQRLIQLMHADNADIHLIDGFPTTFVSELEPVIARFSKVKQLMAIVLPKTNISMDFRGIY